MELNSEPIAKLTASPVITPQYSTPSTALVSKAMDIISNAPPFQRQSVANTFVGAEVELIGTYSQYNLKGTGFNEQDNLVMHVDCCNNQKVTVYVAIEDIDNFSIIKTLLEKEVITVKGKIDYLSRFDISVLPEKIERYPLSMPIVRISSAKE